MMDMPKFVTPPPANIQAIQPIKFTTSVALYTEEQHIHISVETDSYHIPHGEDDFELWEGGRDTEHLVSPVNSLQKRIDERRKQEYLY